MRKYQKMEDFTLRKNGTTRNCKECEKNYRKQNPQTKEYRDSWTIKKYKRVMFLRARKRARSTGIDFTIEMEDFEIPEYCPVLGLKLTLGDNKNTSPSLDRIDSMKGYVKGNVSVISWRANWLKKMRILKSWIKY